MQKLPIKTTLKNSGLNQRKWNQEGLNYKKATKNLHSGREIQAQVRHHLSMSLALNCFNFDIGHFLQWDFGIELHQF